MKRNALVFLCLAACLSVAHGQSAEQRQATVAYLQGMQTPDGGFIVSRDDTGSMKSSLRATSGGLRSLKFFGGEAKDRPAARAYVERCLDKASGGFAHVPGGTPDVTITAIGLMAAVELQLPRETYVDPGVKYLAANAKSFEEIRIAAAGLEAAGQRPPIVQTWLKEVAKIRRENGTYGDGRSRDTASAAVVVLRLGAKLDQQTNVLQVLRAGQREDGGFGKSGEKGSDLESTYRVMRCFMMLKQKPTDTAALRKLIERCRNADGGYGVTPGAPSTVSGTYYAGIVTQWLDRK